MPLDACFLCEPDSSLIYHEDDTFFAMLGHGPIIEGYSLIATKAHIPSMLDIDERAAEKIVLFAQQVRQRLRPYYGEVLLTEHGRVAPCEVDERSECKANCLHTREAHCYHAHRLVFPLHIDLDEALNKYGLALKHYSSFIECYQKFTPKNEYLYWEKPDGTCTICSAPRQLVRQFFRREIAETINNPDLASWRKFPRLEVVEEAKSRLIERK